MQLTAGGVAGITRDVDFLLTVTCVVSVAAAAGLAEVAREGAAVLEPYAGRGVINTGAVTFHGVVDDYIFRAKRALDDSDADRWRHSALSAYRRIGARWWERALGPDQSRPSPSPRAATLRRDDTGRWSVGFRDSQFVLADLKGLHYLRVLVERPGAEVEALALSDAVSGHPGVEIDQGDTGEPLDAAALAAYRRRLGDLDAELDAADARGDQGAAERATAERDALVSEVRAATGLGGRARRSGASAERARVAVRKAIAAAIAQIDEHDPSLARYLRDAVHTGASCRYDPHPDHPVTWVTR
jgi:hypothetical protein